METINVLLFISRLILCLVFLISSISKLFDLIGFRLTLYDFRVPLSVIRPLALTIPIFELSVSIGLLADSSFWLASIGAIGVLLMFMISVVINLVKGRKPNCHCFGKLYSQPIGLSTLLFDLLLLIIASYIFFIGLVIYPTEISFGWKEFLASAQTLILSGFLFCFLLLGIVIYLILKIYKQNTRLLSQFESFEARLPNSFTSSQDNHIPTTIGLTQGQHAPDFRLRDINNENRTLSSLLTGGKKVILFFIDPVCEPCNSLLPLISRWQGELHSSATIAIVSRGSVSINKAKANEHHLMNIFIQIESEVFDSYKLNATPAVVLISPNGTIVSTPAVGISAISKIIEQIDF